LGGNKKLELTTVGDHYFLLGLSITGSTSLHFLHQLHIGGDFAENDVLAVQPRGDDRADEELGTVRVWASIGHGKDARLSVLEGEVLIGELLAINGFSTSSVATREITPLDHKFGDDTVELAPLETEALLAGAEGTEVLGRLRDDVGAEFELDATSGGATDRDVEVDLGVWHCRWVSKDARESAQGDGENTVKRK